MKVDQEEKRITKRDFDSLCPYCRSRAVYLSGAYRTNVGEPGNQLYFSGAYIEDWCCAKCYTSFELF